LKIYIKILILSIVISVSFLKLQAQDIHFSQFYASPLSVSPAFTGNYKGDWRFMNNYRSQWGAITIPYRTISIGYDQNFYFYSEKFSGGIYLVNDQSGHASLAVNKIFLSAAYHKTINYHNLHVGIQPGFVLKSYGMDEITFPDQWDRNTGVHNNSLPNNENTLDQNLSYFDMNLGFGWSKKFMKFEPIAGETDNCDA